MAFTGPEMLLIPFALWGVAALPLCYWARKPIWVKFQYFRGKGKGAKIVDYYTSDGDHDVFCVTPDNNLAFKIKERLHSVGENSARWSRFYGGRMLYCQDNIQPSFDPLRKDVPSIQPEMIEAAQRKIQRAEQSKQAMYQQVKSQDWMIPAILCVGVISAILAFLAMNSQADVVAICQGTAPLAKPAAQQVISNVTTVL